jgi:MFS family permease
MLNLFSITHVFAFIIVITMTLGEMLSMPFMNSYWISRSKTHNRGQYAALYTMAWSAAQTFGPMTGAQVAEHYGFKLLWWLVSALSLITALGFMRLHVYSGRQIMHKEQNGRETADELKNAAEEAVI